MTEVIGLSLVACYGLFVAVDVLPGPHDLVVPIANRLRSGKQGDFGLRLILASPSLRAATIGFTTLTILRMPLVAAVASIAGFKMGQLRGLWRRSLRPIETGDAIASWAELLADDIKAGRGLQQALTRTAPRVRRVIKPAADDLLRRAEDRPLPQALSGLDDDLDHPCGDLLAVALDLAASGETQDVSRPLRMVATRSRLLSEKLASADAKRAGARKAARTVLWSFGVVCPGPLIVLRSSMGWYSTPTGQVFLAIVAATVVWALLRLSTLAALRVPPRVLSSGPAEVSAQEVQ